MDAPPQSDSRSHAVGARRPVIPIPGAAATDWELTATDGSTVSLSAFWNSRPIVLVFLRHLGCIFCREQIARLRDGYGDFTQAGAEIVCIAQGDAKTGKAFSILFELPYPILMTGDSVDVYKAYGLQRGTLAQLFGLPSIVHGLKAMFSGVTQGKLVGDGFQMPGIFIVDQSGIVRFSRVHRNAADNPTNRELLDAIRALN